MKFLKNFFCIKQLLVLITRLSLIVLGLLFLTSCSIALPTTDQNLVETQSALAIQQTLVAIEASENQAATAQVPNATLPPQPPQATIPGPPTASGDQMATQVAISVQQTLQAPQTVQPQQPTAQVVQPTQPGLPPPTQGNAPATPFQAGDLETQMKSAKILLYEDMIDSPDTIRFVKKTLDSMGLPYTDVGSARGWLKTQLLSGGPDGKGWDLIIIASEDHAGISGEFFDYVNTALDEGASVILEVYYLEDTAAGSAGPLLSRCGVEFEKDWYIKGASGLVMYPLDFTHPVMQEPNSGLSFSDVMAYWNKYSFNDVGDLIKKSYNKNAQLVIGTIATDKNTHGTLAICENGRLTLQTFCSHNLTYDAMGPLWENYIYNALKAHFTGEQ